MADSDNHKAEAGRDRPYYGTPEQFCQVLRSTEQIAAAAPAEFWGRADVRSAAAMFVAEVYDRLLITGVPEGDEPVAGGDGWPTDDEIAGLLHGVHAVVLRSPGAWSDKALAEGRLLSATLNRLVQTEGGQ